MENKERDLKKKFNLSKLSDEQLKELMDSVETDEEYEDDFNSDNDYNEPDYYPNEISAEDDHSISQCIREMQDEQCNFSMQDVSISFNISSIDDEPSASNSITITTATEIAVNTEAETSTSTNSEALTVSGSKPQKRARSPLPLVENTGPSIVPSAGGFTGSSTIGRQFLK